jgi:hypothetical protein
VWLVDRTIASHGTSLSDKAMADAADVVDGASMAEECPTTLTPPSPPVLSFNQNVAADINVVKAKTFFFFFYVYDSWAIHADGKS